MTSDIVSFTNQEIARFDEIEKGITPELAKAFKDLVI